MDEQECILEIVDGVVTLVPKDKSISLNSDEEKSEEEEEKNSIEDQISHNDGKKRKKNLGRKLKYLKSINKIRNTTSVQLGEQMLLWI